MAIRVCNCFRRCAGGQVRTARRRIATVRAACKRRGLTAAGREAPRVLVQVQAGAGGTERHRAPEALARARIVLKMNPTLIPAFLGGLRATGTSGTAAGA